MRRHYDFTGGVRGKYARRVAEGTNVVVLDPDVARVFRDPESVNATLRAVVRLLEIPLGGIGRKKSVGRSTRRSRTGDETSAKPRRGR